jgi:hypothetical protein
MTSRSKLAMAKESELGVNEGDAGIFFRGSGWGEGESEWDSVGSVGSCRRFGSVRIRTPLEIARIVEVDDSDGELNDELQRTSRRRELHYPVRPVPSTRRLPRPASLVEPDACCRTLQGEAEPSNGLLRIGRMAEAFGATAPITPRPRKVFRNVRATCCHRKRR